MIERIRKFNTRDVYGAQGLDNDMCWLVKADDRLFMRGQTGFDFNQQLQCPDDAAGQASQAMDNVAKLLEEVGSGLENICKVTTYITDRAFREPVYNVVGDYLRGIPTAATGLIVRGLAVPQMKVELDIEAVMPNSRIERFRVFNTGNWFTQAIRRDSCMVVKTKDDLYLRGQTGAELDGSKMHGVGHSAQAAGEQAEQIMRNAIQLLGEAGSSLEEVCKLRVYISDRAHRESVYQVIGRHFANVRPCSTGLIVRGFARAPILCELDMAVSLADEAGHNRFRSFDTSQWYRDQQDLRCQFSMATRAGNRLYLRGQTGFTLDGQLVGLGDAGAQANQAMKNIRQLLEEAGASLSDVVKVSTFIRDRADRRAVYQTMGQHLKGVYPVGTGIIVNALANPSLLVEIDVEAVVS